MAGRMLTTLPIVDKVQRELVDNCDKRYRWIVGGRCKGASYSIARIFLSKLVKESLFAVCVREVQKTIKDSVKKLLEDTIRYAGWEDRYFKIKNTEIVGCSRYNRFSRFAFYGLHDYNADNIKSLEGADLCWLAESQSISRNSLNVLRPTIRKPNAEFWGDLNPRYATDPVFADYIERQATNAKVCKLNWRDNPWFNDAMREEMRNDFQRSPLEADHIWEGALRHLNLITVLAREDLLEAMRRFTIVRPHDKLCVGADIAHKGGDEIAFYKRKGVKVVNRFFARFLTVPESSRKLDAFKPEKDIPLNIDNGHVGAAVADTLEEDGHVVRRINFGGRPKDTDHYEDTVTEMFFEFRQLLPSLSLQYDEETLNQLCQRRYKHINGRRGYEVIKVESKDEFKDHAHNVNPSPDRGDALLLCYYTPEEGGYAGETLEHNVY